MIDLIYDGKLPSLRGKIVHPMARHALKKQAQLVFGLLPSSLCATLFAHVRVTRVLGPGQRLMDSHDNLRSMLSGLVDALKPSYIVDDSDRWALIDYRQDSSRRSEGPRIEVSIGYANTYGKGCSSCVSFQPMTVAPVWPGFWGWCKSTVTCQQVRSRGSLGEPLIVRWDFTCGNFHLNEA